MLSVLIDTFSGLGVFLFGMYYLESALKDASGAKFRIWVRNFTSTTPKALLTGAATTAVLQSSSVVSLMALSFVGAGILTLSNAIGVIFGSNLGTTFTAWIVATLGFKVKISAFALPMTGLGGLLLVFFKQNKRISAISRILIGFGLLFLGLDFIKSATESLSQSFDLKVYADYPLLFFLFIGFLITAIIQSSSAATAIILSSLFAGIINFDMAAAGVIGTNVGTTVTAILGALGGTSDKKRAALAHFLFNVFTAIAALMLLPAITYLIFHIFLIQDETIALALFHTLFNLLGIALLSPFVGMISRLLSKVFVEKAMPLTLFIDKVQLDIPDAGIAAMRNETIHLMENVLHFALYQFHVKPSAITQERKKVKEILSLHYNIDEDYDYLYGNIKKLEMKIRTFGTELSTREMNRTDAAYVNRLQNATREATYAAKLLKDITGDIRIFHESENPFLKQTYGQFKHRIVQISRQVYLLHQGDNKRLSKACSISKTIAEEHAQTQKNITKTLVEFKLQEEEAATVLNANKAIDLAAASLIESSLLIQASKEELEAIKKQNML